MECAFKMSACSSASLLSVRIGASGLECCLRKDCASVLLSKKRLSSVRTGFFIDFVAESFADAAGVLARELDIDFDASCARRTQYAIDRQCSRCRSFAKANDSQNKLWIHLKTICWCCYTSATDMGHPLYKKSQQSCIVQRANAQHNISRVSSAERSQGGTTHR